MLRFANMGSFPVANQNKRRTCKPVHGHARALQDLFFFSAVKWRQSFMKHDTATICDLCASSRVISCTTNS